MSKGDEIPDELLLLSMVQELRKQNEIYKTALQEIDYIIVPDLFPDTALKRERKEVKKIVREALKVDGKEK